MSDSDRLDKLQRIEVLVRKHKWTGVTNSGAILCCATKRGLIKCGIVAGPFRSLRAAIDAAPDPTGKRKMTGGIG